MDNSDIKMAGIIAGAVLGILGLLVLGATLGGYQTVDMHRDCVTNGGSWVNSSYNCIK